VHAPNPSNPRASGHVMLLLSAIVLKLPDNLLLGAGSSRAFAFHSRDIDVSPSPPRFRRTNELVI
jgi:hypothetical protein